MNGCRLTAPALVLGSTQPMSHVDSAAAAAAGIDVVRRRSGGAAVLVEPDALVWVEVVVPAEDPLWHKDVGRAGWWLGRAWADALGDLGATGADVHRGGIRRSPWSDRACFAGLGPSEVTVAGGSKAVGLSQRRTRDGALFQCAVPLRWDPGRLAELLALPPPERVRFTADLTGRVSPLTGVAPESVLAALLRHLPSG